MTITEAKKVADTDPNSLTVYVTESWWYESVYQLGGPRLVSCPPGEVDSSWLRTIRRFGSGMAHEEGEP